MYCLLFTTEHGNSFASLCAMRLRDRVLQMHADPTPSSSTAFPTFLRVVIKHMEGNTTEFVCPACDDARILLNAALTSPLLAECIPDLFVDLLRFPAKTGGVANLGPRQLRALHDAGVPLQSVRVYDCVTIVDNSGYVPLREMHKLDGVGQLCYFPVLANDTFVFDLNL
jgi:hypothetical protein